MTDFDQFFKENYQRFFHYALTILKDEEASRDIVYEGFEHVWEKHLDNPQEWKRYANIFIHNKCVDHLRHQAVHQKYAEYYARNIQHDSNSFSERDERIDLVKKQLEMLPPKTRHIVEECFLNEKKYKEVAGELNISTNAVKKHIVKALKELRAKVGGKEKE